LYTARKKYSGCQVELGQLSWVSIFSRTPDIHPATQAWIEAVTNEPVTGPFGDALRSGVTLCKVREQQYCSSVIYAAVV